MKRARGTMPLVITFLVLLASSVAVEFLGAPRFGEAETRRSLEPLLPGFQVPLCVRVTIDGPDAESVDLHRHGEEWSVGPNAARTADSDAVRRALETLDSLEQGRIVASGATDLARYGLQGPEAIRVRARGEGGRELAELWIGKQQDYRATFLKLAGEDTIRRVERTIRRSFQPPATTGWRDRTILAAGSADQVVRLTISGSEGRLVFEREEGEDNPGWVMREPLQGPALRWRIDGMASFMSELECDRFHDGTPPVTELGLDPPDRVVTAERSDGTTTEIHMGEVRHDGRRAVQIPGDEQVWWLQAFLIEPFLKPAETYLDERAPSDGSSP